MSLCPWLSGLLSSESESPGAHQQAGVRSQSPPHLARCFDAFPDAEVDHGEDEHDAEGELPADAPQVLKPLGPMDLQDVAPGASEKGRPVNQRAEGAPHAPQGSVQRRSRLGAVLPGPSSRYASGRAGAARPGGGGYIQPTDPRRAQSPQGGLQAGVASMCG